MFHHLSTSPLFPYTTLFRSLLRPAFALRGARQRRRGRPARLPVRADRKSTRLNSSHLGISYAVFCLKKKKRQKRGNCVLYNDSYAVSWNTTPLVPSATQRVV